MYIKFFIVSLLVVNSLVCMHHPEDPSMKKINSWKDMMQFAGVLIAYRMSSPNIISDNDFRLNINSAVNFGFVSCFEKECNSHLPQDLKAYSLKPVRKQSSKDYIELKNSTISEGLWVRRATHEELSKIHLAIKNQQAYW